MYAVTVFPGRAKEKMRGTKAANVYSPTLLQGSLLLKATLARGFVRQWVYAAKARCKTTHCT